MNASPPISTRAAASATKCTFCRTENSLEKRVDACAKCSLDSCVECLAQIGHATLCPKYENLFRLSDLFGALKQERPEINLSAIVNAQFALYDRLLQDGQMTEAFEQGKTLVNQLSRHLKDCQKWESFLKVRKEYLTALIELGFEVEKNTAMLQDIAPYLTPLTEQIASIKVTTTQTILQQMQLETAIKNNTEFKSSLKIEQQNSGPLFPASAHTKKPPHKG